MGQLIIFKLKLNSKHIFIVYVKNIFVVDISVGYNKMVSQVSFYKSIQPVQGQRAVL